MIIKYSSFLWAFRTWMSFYDIAHMIGWNPFLEDGCERYVKKLIERRKHARFSLSSTIEWLILLMVAWWMMSHGLCISIFLILCSWRDEIMWFQEKSRLSGCKNYADSIHRLITLDVLPSGQGTAINISSIAFHPTFFTGRGDFAVYIEENNFRSYI
jgi:hypothetical protein